jgi:hypothetical protein
MTGKISQEVEIKNLHSALFHKKGIIVGFGLDPVPKSSKRVKKGSKPLIVHFPDGREFGFGQKELRFIKHAKNN